MNAYDPSDISGQEAVRASAAEKAGLKRAKEDNEFRWLMNQPQFRRWMWRMLEKTGVFRTSFTGNSATYFNEGQRNVGLMMIGQVHELTPDLYVQMMKDAKNE